MPLSLLWYPVLRTLAPLVIFDSQNRLLDSESLPISAGASPPYACSYLESLQEEIWMNRRADFICIVISQDCCSLLLPILRAIVSHALLRHFSCFRQLNLVPITPAWPEIDSEIIPINYDHAVLQWVMLTGFLSLSSLIYFQG